MITFEGQLLNIKWCWSRKRTNRLASRLMRTFHCSFSSYKLKSLYIEQKCLTLNLQNHIHITYKDTLLKKFSICVELKRIRPESLAHFHSGLVVSVRFWHISAFNCQLTVRGKKWSWFSSASPVGIVFLLIVNIRPYTELSHFILSVLLVVRDILRLFLNCEILWRP